jgi:hypothetical protein
LNPIEQRTRDLLITRYKNYMYHATEAAHRHDWTSHMHMETAYDSRDEVKMLVYILSGKWQ